ncbi:MAG: hypothetical protein AB7H92_07440 [Microbacteriaceae bacterium]
MTSTVRNGRPSIKRRTDVVGVFPNPVALQCAGGKSANAVHSVADYVHGLAGLQRIQHFEQGRLGQGHRV